MKTKKGGANMRKFTEYEVYKVFSDIYAFMQVDRELCNYILYEDDYLLSTDGFKMIRKKFPFSNDNNFSLTKEDVKRIIDECKRKRKKEYVKIDENDMYLYIGSAIIMKKPRNFPDWKAVYPNFTYTNEVNFVKSEVLDMMKELSKFKTGKLKKHSCLHIKIEKNNYMQLSLIDLTAYTPIPISQKQLKVMVSLDKDSIGFCVNFNYFMDCIKACDDNITLKFYDNEHPIIITDGMNTEILLMCMKIHFEL